MSLHLRVLEKQNLSYSVKILAISVAIFGVGFAILKATGELHFGNEKMKVSKSRYVTKIVENVEIFPDSLLHQDVKMTPMEEIVFTH